MYDFIWHFSTVSKVLLSTGYPMDFSTKTEVIDLLDSNVVCKDLDNFPIEGLYESAGANLDQCQ